MITLLQDSVSVASDKAVALAPPSIELGSLYEPPPVAFHFETVGWTILLGLVLLVLLILAYFMIRNYRNNRYRREALSALDNASDVSQIFVILKRVAIRVFGREKAGTLYGSQWLSFLDQTGKGVQMSSYQKALVDAIYQGNTLSVETNDGILVNAKKWVKTHGSGKF